MADIDYRAPLVLQVPQLEGEPPAAAECPACFALVLAEHLANHLQASHG